MRDHVKVLTPTGERDWGSMRFWAWAKLNWLSAFIMLAGLLIGMAAIQALTPGYWPKSFEPIPDTKRIFLAQDKGDVDVVMMGTSHVYRGWLPDAFEEESGVSAYSMSYPGMTCHEMEKMVDFVVKHAEEKGVKNVIMEARACRANLPSNIFTDRAVFEHDIQTNKDIISYWNEMRDGKIPSNAKGERRYIVDHMKSSAVYFTGAHRLMRYDFQRELDDPERRVERARYVRDAINNDDRIIGAYVPKKRNKPKPEDKLNRKWKEHVKESVGREYDDSTFGARFRSVMGAVLLGNPREANRNLTAEVRDAEDYASRIRLKGHSILKGKLAEKNYDQKREKYAKLMEMPRATGRNATMSETEAQAYNRMFAKLRSVGVEPHLMIWPTIAPQWRARYDMFLNAQDDGRLDEFHMIDLRREPYRDPFYDMSLWADEGHLNWKGAPLASREVARLMMDDGVLETETKN